MILDLITRAKTDGYTGVVRSAEWSETEQQYKYNYFQTHIVRTTRDDAREDARNLALEIARENNLEVIHSEMQNSITAVQK